MPVLVHSGTAALDLRTLVSTASMYPSTSTMWNPSHYLSPSPSWVYEEPPTFPMVGPPVDEEPPVWPLWLRLTPTPDVPPPVCLEIPAVADLIFHPQFRGGEQVDPISRLTPSESAAWNTRQREAREYLQEEAIAEEKREQSRWSKLWRKKVA